MADPTDETGYADVPRDSEYRTEPRDRLGVPLDDEDISLRIVRRAKFPGLILAAGILWILAGAAYVALFAASYLFQVSLPAGGFLLILGAAFFVKDGVQLIRGKSGDPIKDGIITLLIGLYFFGRGGYDFTQSGNVIALAIDTFFGLIFLVPGILVLLGRKNYLRWKATQED